MSVVVPTRDRPDMLRRCLAALARQHGVEIEIVVVDDGSVRADAVAAIVAREPRARLVRLEGRGPAAARNAGAAVAYAPVVCFTDDDCEPSLGWAEHLAAFLAERGGAAGGSTIAGDPSNPVDVASERITGHLRTFSNARADGRGFLASNNVACSRALILRVPFDEAYGVGGEDRDWCERVVAMGETIWHVPDALVVHTPGLDLKRFWRQQVRYGRGAYAFAQTHNGRARPQPVAFYATLLRDAMRDGIRPFLLVVVAQVATTVGVAQMRFSLQSVSQDAVVGK